MRGSWLKQRWKTAKQQQTFYNKEFKQNLSSREFFKNKNPLSESVTKYTVTFKLNYQGKTGYEFLIPQESFDVYVFDNPEISNTLKENTKQGVSSIFRGKAIDWIYNHLNVEVRGMEKKSIRYEDIDVDKLKFSHVYNDELPDVTVNKKPRSGKGNINIYKLDIWN